MEHVLCVSFPGGPLIFVDCWFFPFSCYSQESAHKFCTKEMIQEIHDETSANDHWRKEHKLFHRKSEIEPLEQQISSAHSRTASTVISVWGVAGVGKSFLVKALYDHYAGNFDSRCGHCDPSIGD